MTAIALSLGGNLGDVSATFRSAANDLALAGVTDIKLSSFFRTAPVGCAPGTPDFINAALTGNWSGSVEELHELCRLLEVKNGRPRDHESYVSRTLDIDIVFFGSEIINTPDLTIPHKEASNRLFVLVPLAEVAGDWFFPGTGSTVNDVLDPFRNSDEFKALSESFR